MKLESEAVTVEFFVAELSWKTTNGLVSRFQDTFSKFAPMFLDAAGAGTLKINKSGEKEGSFRTLYSKEDTTLTLQTDLLHAGYLIRIQTTLNDFDDHFEVFVTDAARAVFPATEKPARKHTKIEFRPPDRDQLQAALAYYAKQLSAGDVAEIAANFDGWNFRQVARFAENVLRRYVASLDLTQLEARDPPLPAKADYLLALPIDGFR